MMLESGLLVTGHSKVSFEREEKSLLILMLICGIFCLRCMKENFK